MFRAEHSLSFWGWGTRTRSPQGGPSSATRSILEEAHSCHVGRKGTKSEKLLDFFASRTSSQSQKNPSPFLCGTRSPTPQCVGPEGGAGGGWAEPGPLACHCSRPSWEPRGRALDARGLSGRGRGFRSSCFSSRKQMIKQAANRPKVIVSVATITTKEAGPDDGLEGPRVEGSRQASQSPRGGHS